MTPYIGHAIIFVTALVALVGGTWDPAAFGIRRLTLTGKLLFVLATFGLIVSIVSTHESESTQEKDRKVLHALPVSLQAYRTEILQVLRDANTPQAVVHKIESLSLVSLDSDKGVEFANGSVMLNQQAHVRMEEAITKLRSANPNPVISKLLIIGHADATPFAKGERRFDEQFTRRIEANLDSRVEATSNFELAFLRACY